jgi:short-subunit dehydrogenase involved in D-alanine esterification of teichoic acids
MLDSKKVIVTGASVGIGSAIAYGLAEFGSQQILTKRYFYLFFFPSYGVIGHALLS